MKKIPLILSLILIISLLAGCAGTPVVYYTNCTCPADAHTPAPTTPVTNNTVDVPTESDGAWKTGLYINTSIADSKAATAEADGVAKYDVLMAAVLIDGNGVIQDCIIDGVSTSIEFNAAGEITTKLEVAPVTKNELGDAYGMRKASSIAAEWNEQAAAIAKFTVGKTVEEFEKGAISETGKAPEGTDLASSATMYMSSYVNAVKMAVANAKPLGAGEGDTLKMATIMKIDGSTAASPAKEGEDGAAAKDGTAQLDVDVVALTMNGETITSCELNSTQAKVAFDTTGAIKTADLSAPVLSKNELGAAYNMVLYGKAKAEWNEQAAAFAKYVTGKTPAQVAGISVAEDTKPTDADLLASVTIKVGGFMDLIAKACK